MTSPGKGEVKVPTCHGCQESNYKEAAGLKYAVSTQGLLSAGGAVTTLLSWTALASSAESFILRGHFSL